MCGLICFVEECEDVNDVLGVIKVFEMFIVNVKMKVKCLL